MEKIKILQVLTIMNRGGAETMVMNYYRALDKSKYQFDFLVHRQERGSYDDEIENMGGIIYRTYSIRPGHFFKYFHFLDSFFREHAKEYVAVHCHIQENSGYVLKYAARYGIKNRVCTSHIADLGIDYKYIFRKIGKFIGNKYITHRLACGVKAGIFLYGKKDFKVFHNAIPAKEFLYNPASSDKLRQERGWKDKLIIGNVARFGYQKNHRFIIDVFKEIHSLEPKAVLVLVGDGELRKSIEDKVNSLCLNEVVFFEGIQSNIPKYLSSFDLLLFPSLFEGLPVSIIEAQASGLKCFLSDTIDRSVDITNNITFMPLSSSSKEWAQSMLQSIPYERKNNLNAIEDAGYDVKKNLKNLLSIYLN